MDNMEKIGSNSSYKYQNIFENNKNTIENDNMFENEMNILKESQKYLDDDNDDIKQRNKNEKSIEKNYININIDNENDNDIEDYFNNKDTLNKNKREINTIINNDVIIKRNKESLDFQHNINKKHKSFNTDIRADKKKENISYHKIDISNSYKGKKQYHNKKLLKNRNYNYNSQSFTEGNISKNKFTELDEDIKMENKTLNQNINHKNFIFNNEFIFNDEIDKKDFLYNTDGRDNRKNEKLETIKKKFGNDDNNFEESNNLNFYNTNNINANENNNLLKYSQNKSQLSDYVEDLDVIQYK
jgi:hypothetical protein